MNRQVVKSKFKKFNKRGIRTGEAVKDIVPWANPHMKEENKNKHHSNKILSLVFISDWKKKLGFKKFNFECFVERKSMRNSCPH
jgi:hypothetical protein